MAKVQIKPEKFTPFGGLFYVANQFTHHIMPHVDNYLGRRSQLVGYQYGEILFTIASNFFSGGNRMEDINVLKSKLPEHPEFRICSPDTALRVLKELAEDDIEYSTSEGKEYKFNTAENFNGLLIYTAVKSGMLSPGKEYDFGWHYLPKGLLKENTVFMILTAIIRNFYAMLLQMSKLRTLKVYATTRMKAFINRVVSVVAKWTKSGRQDVLTIYTQNTEAYATLFAEYG